MAEEEIVQVVNDRVNGEKSSEDPEEGVGEGIEEERKPKGRQESKKKEPSQWKHNSGHSLGWMGQRRNACLMSTLAI